MNCDPCIGSAKTACEEIFRSAGIMITDVAVTMAPEASTHTQSDVIIDMAVSARQRIIDRRVDALKRIGCLLTPE